MISRKSQPKNQCKKKKGAQRRAHKPSQATSSQLVRVPLTRGPFTLYRANDPFAPSKNVSLIYSQTLILTGGTAGIYGTENIFNLNGMFDPDYTGIGHQPYGFDQMSALYRNYRVRGITIELTWSAPSALNTYCAAMLQPSDGTYVLTSQYLDAAREQPMTDVHILNTTGSQTAHVKQNISIAEIEGRLPIEIETSTSYIAPTGGNPGKRPLLRIAAGTAQTGSSTVTCNVRLTYHATFNSRVAFAQS